MDQPDVLSRATERPDAVVRYAPHPDGVVDLFVPSGTGPWPLVVFVHGGFWRQAWDRTHVRPLARALVAEGCLVAAPEYRRVGGGGGWPATAQDVRAAVEALPQLLRGLGFVTTSATLAGHSAGGHLALWLANEPAVAGTVDRVVGLAPVADLVFALTHRLGDGAVDAFLAGADPAPADPAARLAARPPMSLAVVHGSQDGAVPVASSRGLVARHPWLDYVELPDVEHFGLIDPASSAWPTVRDLLVPGAPPAGERVAR